ncbi:MAG: hypothetical protein INF13_11135 [Methylobacterium sp.]|nr:hypothetical protein [Methylobacterium sp.]
MTGTVRKECKAVHAEEAVRRVKLIVNLLLDDVRMAVTAHVTMETLNDTIPALGDQPTDPAYTVKAIQDAPASKVAMNVARIFDVTENGRYPAEEQDKASIPVLAALAINGTDIDPQVWIDRDRDRTLRFCRCLIAGVDREASAG